MKRRGWRVALTVATLGLALVTGLVVFNWQTVRDHAEAWWFQATKETQVVLPPKDNEPERGNSYLFQRLATFGKRPVIFDAASVRNIGQITPDPNESARTLGELLLKALQTNGFRILEQRFPRRAYVVVGYPTEWASPPRQRPPRVRGSCFPVRSTPLLSPYATSEQRLLKEALQKMAPEDKRRIEEALMAAPK